LVELVELDDVLAVGALLGAVDELLWIVLDDVLAVGVLLEAVDELLWIVLELLVE
jgi:hypothetical protein